MYRIICFFIFSLISSCAWVGSYIKQIDAKDPQSALIEKVHQFKKCEAHKQQMTIYASDMQDTMDSFLSLCTIDQQVSDEIKVKRCFLNLAIYQMLLRPDKITPFSSPFLIVQNKSDIKLLDGAKNKELNYWMTLVSLAKAWGQSTWFSSQISNWITNPKVALKVVKELEVSINEKKNIFLKSSQESTFKNYYYRGDELISEGEDLPYANALSYLKDTKLGETVLIEKIDLGDQKLLKQKNKLSYRCNFNVDVVMDGKVFAFSKPVESTLFAVKMGNWMISMAAFGRSHVVNAEKSVLSYFLLKPQNLSTIQDDIKDNTLDDTVQTPGPQYCYLKKNENTSNEDSVLVSSYEGRDPTQYIASVMNYLSESSLTVESLNLLMQSPRHLLMLNPLRLAFEVERASEVQTQNILNLGIPVFNEKKLGLLQMNGFLAKSLVYVPDRRGTQDFCSYSPNSKGSKK